MNKNIAFIVLAFIFSNVGYAQSCNCASNFDWVKKTFEQNDAGFKYVIDTKGEQAYNNHNQAFGKKVKAEKDFNKCAALLYDWLTFFRSGHISIRVNEKMQATNTAPATKQIPNAEILAVAIPEFEKYLDSKTTTDFEGIWDSSPYKVGIRKEGDHYIGFIIESAADTWKPGQVKLKITTSGGVSHAVYYLRDHSRQETDVIELTGKNHLKVGAMNLVRLTPKLEDEPEVIAYLKLLYAAKPYLEQLNSTTLLLRIPSFKQGAKKDIDSLLAANRAKLLSTENLIIDIANGTGGSDGSYEELIPYLYTNPIRTLGVEYLSTQLNNQRMQDFINKPEYGFDEKGKQWAKESFEKLEQQRGKFVNLNEEEVSITKFDSIYPFPKHVGIIINNGNGSTDEQFLLAAKQSRKVKLFGVTTFGVLDISNMYFVEAPCKEFTLGYALSRSKRIPGMTIDGKGIQPDYYLDPSIPKYKWVGYVNEVLNGK